MKRTKSVILIGMGVFAGTLLLQVSLGVAGSFESYPVPAATAYAVDVGTTTSTITDADNTSEGAGVSSLVASAHATAWKRNGSARALGFAHTGAGGDGWVFVELSALSDLPADLIEEGGKVVVRVTGAAQSTLADSYTPNVQSRWQLEIGTPGQTQVWSDGTGSNFGGATISGLMLLTMGGTAFSRNDPVASGEQTECLDFNPTDKGCWEFAALPPAPLGSGAASLTRSVTIRMPVGQKFLVWWKAESLNDAIAVIDPVLTVHPDHAQYVALEIDGIEPPTPAPGPLDGVDIGALAARGYNIEQLRTLGLLGLNMSVAPASKDFGDTMIGSPSAQTFTINNNGNADLIISSIALTGGDISKFAIAPGTCSSFAPTIPAGDSCQITVTFAPTSAGAKATTLRIESNDADTPVIDIPLTGTGVLGPVTFADVPSGYWAENYIKTLYYDQITSGCLLNPLSYCPDNPVTRAQMAVFILKSIGQQQAPSCTGAVFNDVNVTTQPMFCGWIEKFSELGITSGCQADDPGTPNVNEAMYCPDSPVTRGQMAVFISKALGEAPAATCTGSVFNDINMGTVSEGFCKYVEKFAELGITSGCGDGNYCPDDPVTRAQMAVFLTKAFLQ